MNDGAVAYLTHSQYGRNRNEVTINNNSSCITGIAGSSLTANSSSSTTNAYNTTAGMLASTTGNIYGVYDMVGGAYEYTAGWNTKGLSYDIEEYGKAVDSEGNELQHFTVEGISDKYKTAYSNLTNGSDNSNGKNTETVYRVGEGNKETRISDIYAWFNDTISIVSTGDEFTLRGGPYGGQSRAGLFSTSVTWTYNGFLNSFRAVLTSGV